VRKFLLITAKKNAQAVVLFYKDRKFSLQETAPQAQRKLA
jgi:hypothetical protein